MDEPLLPGVNRVGKTGTFACVGRRSFEVSRLSDGTYLVKLLLGDRPLAHPILTEESAKALGKFLTNLTSGKTASRTKKHA